MMDSGERISERARGSINMLQETCMTGSGGTTRRMEWACSARSRERNTEKFGRRTSSSLVRLSSEFKIYR